MEKEKSDYEKDILKMYLNDVSTFRRVLTRQQEYDLIVKYQKYNDLKARDEVLTSHLKFVINKAIKFTTSLKNKNLLTDLINAGNEGLIVAIDKFNVKTGNRFLSYGAWYIRERMQVFLKEMAHIRIPHNINVNLYKIRKVTSKYKNTYGNDPNTQEISKLAKITLKEVEDAMSLSFITRSLEEPKSNGDESLTMADLLEDEDSLKVEKDLHQQDLQKEVQNTLSNFTDKERDLVNEYYGLDGNTILTLEQLEVKYNISSTRIRQIVNKVVRLSRHPSRNQNLKNYL